MSFGFAPRTASAYAQVSLETGVSDADPHKLILMLFEGALLSIATASVAIERNDIPGKGQAISKAIEIINDGLKISLDYEAGGELAERLGALYDYMTSRLLYANVHSSHPALDEVGGLLREIKGAWESIGTQV
ncbi:MAG TPA: flagellar export chaperone FliS [Zoogloea sp.]|jgi:flagellar protein FliS|uniref:flagellar export chaperone FliS n=1 Tax=Zoogloea sp. TaxID=49181 RepID=UPI002BED2DA4|nr:flagellar export chaperone FliS [Zoogloea sp.]HOB44606.1 flagellar export chaperone FliS [Zoogloea sp.]HQA09134.1 flagellar export chaperone FliS [Zoogloea sp.]HQE38005.1 flagellar export chaperone FliS [Zoogloea sp.]